MVYDTPLDWKSKAWWRNRSDDERLFHAKIPQRYKNTKVLPCPPLNGWLNTFSLGEGLLITGPSGSGKTCAAVQTLEVIIGMRIGTVGAVSGRFVDSDDYIEMIKDSFDNDGDMPEMYSTPHLLKYIKGVWDVVVLDGLGQERQTEFAKHEIGSLLRHRYDHCLTTIITSTLSAADIRIRYGDRVAGPLAEMKQVTLARS